MKLLKVLIPLFVLLFTLPVYSQKKGEKPFPVEKSPWQKIRKERIQKLLPEAMKIAGVDCWLTVCRENNNDPLALHVGGENATGINAFIFLLDGNNVKSIAISPEGEAIALKDVKLHDEVIVIEKNSNIWENIAVVLKKANPNKIAVNSSSYTIADGLSHSQYTQLEKALGSTLAAKLVPSNDIVTEWLSVKLPEEIAIMEKAAAITDQMERDAYKIVIPNKTKDSDVALYLKKRMEELGVTDGWAADQNPNVNSGSDRGHSNATNKIIRPGDIIQLDFGIKVFGVWCSDIQRFAYVLKPGEKEAPADIQRYFDNAVKGHRKVLAAIKPGAYGYDADKAQREWMKETGSLPVIWGTGHPVGYWAHDSGPSISGGTRPVRPADARVFKAGQTFAYDGFFSWKLDETSNKTISVEEMVCVTETGARYMNKTQDKLILIK
jgi:Xaa-Pro aminopeptidase